MPIISQEKNLPPVFHIKPVEGCKDQGVGYLPFADESGYVFKRFDYDLYILLVIQFLPAGRINIPCQKCMADIVKYGGIGMVRPRGME